MELQKKTIKKEDGRSLLYYHFPSTATPEQTASYDSVDEIKPDGGHSTAIPEKSAEAKEGGNV